MSKGALGGDLGYFGSWFWPLTHMRIASFQGFSVQMLGTALCQRSPGK